MNRKRNGYTSLKRMALLGDSLAMGCEAFEI
jgi:hypothetical protein